MDIDLARIYGVKTKCFYEQVERNISRFPSDFMYRFSEGELEEVDANCDHLKNLKYSSTNPFAFTEHRALMLSGVLNTASTIATNIFIVHAFVKLRELLSSHESIERKIAELQRKYERNFSIVFEVLKQLIKEESEPRKSIGFKKSNNDQEIIHRRQEDVPGKVHSMDVPEEIC